jgi:hypothetical protein
MACETARLTTVAFSEIGRGGRKRVGHSMGPLPLSCYRRQDARQPAGKGRSGPPNLVAITVG